MSDAGLSADKNGLTAKQLEREQKLKLLAKNAGWGDVVRFLEDVQQHVTSQTELIGEGTNTELFAPRLEPPAQGGRILRLATRESDYVELLQNSTRQDSLLLISDVYYLLEQTRRKLVYETDALKEKLALAQSRGIGDTLEAAQLRDRAKTIGELAETIEKEFGTSNELESRSLFGEIALFSELGLSFNLHPNEADAIPLGKDLELITRHREVVSKLRQEADLLLAVARETFAESLLSVEGAAITTEEGQAESAETEAATPEPDSAVVAQTPETEAAEEAGDDRPDETPKEPQPNPQQPQPKPAPTLAEQIDNLRNLNLETERLTNAFIAQLSSHYGLPADLMEDAVFKAMVREDMRQWIIEKLGVDQIGLLYANPTERIKILNGFFSSLNRDPRFSPLLADLLLKHHESLKSDPAAQTAFAQRMAEANDASDWAAFKEAFASAAFTPGEATDISSALADLKTDPVAALKAQLASLSIANFTTSDNATAFINLTDTVDALIARGYQPIFLDVMGKSRFELLFGISLSGDEYLILKDQIQVYWSLRKRVFSEGGVRLDYVFHGLDPADLEEWAQLDTDKTIDADFRRNHISLTKQLVGAGRALGGVDKVVQVAGGKDPHDEAAEAEEAKAEATKTLKFRIHQEEIWNSLTNRQRIAIYLQMDQRLSEEDAVQLLQQNYIPPTFSMNEVGALDHSNGAADGVASYAGGDETGFDPSFDYSPMGRAGSLMQSLQENAGKLKGVKGAAKKIGDKFTGKGKKAAAKAATQKAKDQAEAALLNSLGAAAGIPGLGTLYTSLDPDLRDFLEKLLLAGGIGAGLVNAFMLITSVGARIGAVVGSFFGPLGSFAGTGIGYALDKMGSGALDKLLKGGSGTGGPNLGFSPSTATTGYQVGASGTKAGLTGAKLLTTAIHPATQAVMTTCIGVFSLTSICFMIINSAFLADFPHPETSADKYEKISKYASLEKTVTLPSSCLGPELKCPEITSGQTLEATYTITITPKGDTTLSITAIVDEITATYSKKKYEELGKPVPPKLTIQKKVLVANERSDFEELTADPNDELNIVRPGEQLIITYTVPFTEEHNHTSIFNVFKADFYWTTANANGNDTIQTAKQFCIGDCSMEIGCWPTDGVVTQAPFTSDDTHHAMDAYDIANDSSPLVYTPFDGEACVAHVDDGYGNHIVLTAAEGQFLFGHFADMQITGCSKVKAGDILGVMGTTGNSTGIHLHFELAKNGGFFRAGPPDDLGEMMPPSIENIKLITIQDAKDRRANVETCYGKGK
jgi:hypothetical protein